MKKTKEWISQAILWASTPPPLNFNEASKEIGHAAGLLHAL